MIDLQTLRDRVSTLAIKDPDEALRLEIEIARVEALQVQAVETRNAATASLVVAQQIEYLANVLNTKRFM